jgi:hypothetical protein
MISAETVTQTWQRMAAFPPRQVPQFIEQMKNEQPVILAYLLAESERPPFNTHEGQLVFYLGLVVWQIMKQSPRPLRKVTHKKLRRVEQTNADLLDMLASDTDADFFSATQRMLETYPEPKVFEYIVQAIMDEDEYDPDDPPIREEYRGLAFLHLKVVLDAFISRLAR